MSLAEPLILLLLPLPLLVRLVLPVARDGPEAVSVPNTIADAMVSERVQAAGEQIARALPLLIWTLIVLALAGPRDMRTLDVLPASGRDIMLALDLSGSMKKEDFDLAGERLSRLDAVKRVTTDFVKDRVGDRVGLVVFGERAYVASPLTHDVAAVASEVEGATIGISGTSTAISDGLGLALKRLSSSAAKSSVVILLSDGVDTSGTVDPAGVASVAKALGVRIYTIALGPDDLETEPQSNDAVDAATLREIAEASGGRMFRVRNADALVAVGDALNALEPSPSSAPPLRVWREFWIWPAGAALALAMVALLLRRRIA